MPRLADVLDAALTAARVADEHDIKYPAAAFAYYAFVSFLPVTVLALAVLGDRSAAEVRAAMPRLLTPEARRLVTESIGTASGRTGATMLAIVVFAWSGANMGVDFQSVVERVEGTDEPPLVEQLRDAVRVLGSLSLAALAVVFTGGVFSQLSAGPLTAVAWPLVLLGVLVLAFLPLYYLPSTLVTSPSGALPGALTAAVGWTVLILGIQFYVANAGQYALYGILSGVILILTSLYLAALVLMLGVVVNATRNREDRSN
ncbi:YihY/virulence factor BrkB family protein [Halosimplex salinum]|uniref:YihY/virulence factor BrkB family protein n=1 Tax=Halosimplex salinum TaxID=1710538 RepID=UPI000F4635B6|nr:YihY/virulence factor BrkB family protein [Halosimplex salinum]